MRVDVRKHLVAGLLAAVTAGTLIGAVAVSIEPAHGQITVFDPGNYTQNLLTAARSLQMIDNQIQSLQNQARSLLNQAKNLDKIDFPELQAITQSVQQIDRLMGQAQGIQFHVASLDQQFGRLFPQGPEPASRLSQQVAAAQARMEAARAAYQQTMTAQAQVVENVQADAKSLDAVIARSQNAQGVLQASQATNQLLALAAKQQFQIETLMAAQYRADAIAEARRAQSQADAQAATAKFLGSGNAYTPR